MFRELVEERSEGEGKGEQESKGGEGGARVEGANRGLGKRRGTRWAGQGQHGVDKQIRPH